MPRTPLRGFLTLFLSIFSVTAVAVLSLVLLPWFIDAAGGLSSGFAKARGMTFTYRSLLLSPFLQEASFRGVRFKGFGLDLEVRHARVRLDPRSLLRGDVRNAFYELDLESVKLRFDPSSASGPSLSPPTLPTWKGGRAFTLRIEDLEGSDGTTLSSNVEMVFDKSAEGFRAGLEGDFLGRSWLGHASGRTNVLSGRLFGKAGERIDEFRLDGFYEEDALAAIVEKPGKDLGARLVWNEDRLRVTYFHKALETEWLLGFTGGRDPLPASLREGLRRTGLRLFESDARSDVNVDFDWTAGDRRLRSSLRLFTPGGSETARLVFEDLPEARTFSAKVGIGRLWIDADLASAPWKPFWTGRLRWGGAEGAALSASFVEEAGFLRIDLDDLASGNRRLRGRLERREDRWVLEFPPSGSGLSFRALLDDRFRLRELEGRAERFELRSWADLLGWSVVRDAVADGRLKVRLPESGTEEEPNEGNAAAAGRKILPNFLRVSTNKAVVEADLTLSGAVTGEKRFALQGRLDDRAWRIDHLQIGAGESALHLAVVASTEGDATFRWSRGKSSGAGKGRLLDEGKRRILRIGGGELFESAQVAWDGNSRTAALRLTEARVGKGRLNVVAGWSALEAGRLSGSFKLTEVHPFRSNADAQGRFLLQSGLLALEDLQVQDGILKLEGAGSVRFGSSTVFRLRLAGAEESLEIGGELDRGRIKALVAGRQFDPPKLGVPGLAALPGRLRFLVEANGPLADPSITLRAFLEKGNIGRTPCDLYVEAWKVGRRFDLRRLEIIRLDGERRIAAHLLEGRFEPERIDVLMKIDGLSLGAEASGLAKLTWDDRAGTLRLHMTDFLLSGAPEPDFLVVGNRDGSAWTLEAPGGNGISGVVRRAKDGWEGSLAWMRRGASWAELEGSVRGGRLDLFLTSSRFRAPLVNALAPLIEGDEPVPSPFTWSHGGFTARGVNLALHVGGTASQPLLTGKLRATGRMKLLGLDWCRKYAAEVRVENNVFHFDEAWADFGDSRLTVRGTITSKTLRGVEDYDLAISGEGDGVPVAYAGTWFDLKGRMLGDIRLTGSHAYPRLAGDLRFPVADMTFERRGGGGAARWEDKRNQFMQRADWAIRLVPQGRCKLESALFDLVLEENPGVLFSGTLYNDSWSIRGELRAKGGTWLHAGTDFRVKSCVLNLPSGEVGFNPMVDLVAVLSVRDGKSKETVEVTMEKQSRLMDFERASYRSSPPRRIEEIRALLGLGDPGGTAGNASLATGSRALAQALFLKPLERTLRKSLGVDMFTIDSDVYNLAQGNSNAPGKVTTTLSVGKYLGEGLFLQSDVAVGVGGGTNTVGAGIGLEYDLKFFNLEGRVQVPDFSQLNRGSLNPVEASLRLGKSWSF